MTQVIIAGAGPCGLLLALLLAKDRIEVTVLDGADKLDDQPRACYYAAPATVEFERAGVLDQIKSEGIMPRSVCWRTSDGTRVTGMHNTTTPESSPLRLVSLTLGRVVEILAERAAAAGVSIRMQHLVTGLGQDEGKAWVEVKIGPDGKELLLEADYIIGCDGANSQVRRSLFGAEFPGSTWEKQIIATNVYYPFEKFGYEDANFIVHPENWYMAAKIAADGLWRVTYGDVPNLTKAEYEQRLPMRYKEILPGSPEPTQYKVINVGPYKMHQRIAEKMRVGRVLLAGDAAHLCNPFGGLGLTGGIADIGGLYDCLRGIHLKVADESILDKYDEKRREKYSTLIDPMSTSNFKRLWEKSPEETIATDPFFEVARKAEQDKEFSRTLLKDQLSIQHDFTQYYQGAPIAA
ncbi:putative monooxygenase [Microdochium bolleyi]|uniref:Putative monooxygenase n=1 Tax=Microdochium bolleyi TaxID=196109 RepID=A0A136IS67_9PEZI|nr:putative monooxygenase [Microdochium bolleyi]